MSKRKPQSEAQNPKPPKQVTAKNPPTGLPAMDNVPTTTVAEFSPSHEPLILGQVPSTTFSSLPLNTTADVLGMDVDFSTPQVSAHGLATGAQPGPSFQASSSISHELPTYLIQSHETTLTADYPPGPPSAHPTSGATLPMSEKEKGKNRKVPLVAPAQSTSLNMPLPQVATSLDDDSRELICLVENDSNIFQVKAPVNKDVTDLKKLIHEEGKHGVLSNVDAKDLVLWKVDIDLHTHDEDSLSQLNPDNGFEKLVGWKPITQYWPTQPARDSLHVFVKLPAAAGEKRVYTEHSSLADRSSTLQEISHNLAYFKQAFEFEYVAPYPDILLTTMDLYTSRNNEEYYNRSFSIVQSSGMGKSRLVDHSATSRFTFPFNLHEVMSTGSKTYPPFDDNVRDYLTMSFVAEEPALTRHFAFLEALFHLAVEELNTYEQGTPAEVALAWYKWMNHGASDTNVGTNRALFYDRVIEAARRLESLTPTDLRSVTPKPQDVLGVRQKHLIKAAQAFCCRLNELHGHVGDKFVAMVYFDEAHTLRGKSPHYRSPYFALMHVLGTLVEIPIFFIFPTTNSSLSTLTPTSADYPSLRVQKGWKLIPPFFELPFDTFCQDFTAEVRDLGKLTLSGVCELEQVVKFGRPMWNSHYLNVPDNLYLHPTIRLAMMKLKSGKSVTDPLVGLAALDCRVLIRFDPIQSNSRATQADLVRSCLRTVFNIPEKRDFMWSGYPSEPILAEAAARLLHDPPTSQIMCRAPDILESALNSGLLARGERGELVARTLLIVAHDRAIIKCFPEMSSGPHFHRPVRFVELLQCLLAPDIWTVVRDAQPFHAFANDLTLEQAFKDAWVNFSHFVLLGDHASFTLHCGSEFLKRGAAIQTFDNQYNMDGGIPLLFGDPLTIAISEENTSMAQYQVKNAEKAIQVFPDAELVGLSKKNLPIISIIMQFGVEMKDGERVVVTTTPKGLDIPTGSQVKSHPADINRRHYVITLYGCTSMTYSCIPENSRGYRQILRAQKPFADFPRASFPPNASSVIALKPMIYDKGGVYMPWS